MFLPCVSNTDSSLDLKPAAGSATYSGNVSYLMTLSSRVANSTKGNDPQKVVQSSEKGHEVGAAGQKSGKIFVVDLEDNVEKSGEAEDMVNQSDKEGCTTNGQGNPDIKVEKTALLQQQQQQQYNQPPNDGSKSTVKSNDESKGQLESGNINSLHPENLQRRTDGNSTKKKHAKKPTTHESIARKKQQRHVRLLKVISLVWLSLTLTWGTFIISFYLTIAGVFLPNLMYTFMSILISFNATCNFFIYLLKDREFRKEFKRLFTPRCLKKRRNRVAAAVAVNG